MEVDPSPQASAGFRVFQHPPAGYHVEWQVLLEMKDGTTKTWGAYAPHYQTIIEQLFVSGVSGMDYQPGQSQTYRIDFMRLLQVRTSCSEGWGSERPIRRVFVPDDVPQESSASGSVTAS